MLDTAMLPYESGECRGHRTVARPSVEERLLVANSMLSHYLEGWAEADPAKVADATAEDYVFYDPLVGRYSKQTLPQYFALLRSRFVVAGAARSQDLAFTLRGPMLGPSHGARRHRASKSPPGQGGWGMFHTWHAGADCANPAGYIAVRGTGDKAWFGWPESAEVEKEVAAWFAAKDLAEETAAVARLNKAAMEHVVYIPTGFYYGYHAWRSNVSGIVKGPLPFF